MARNRTASRSAEPDSATDNGDEKSEPRNGQLVVGNVDKRHYIANTLSNGLVALTHVVLHQEATVARDYTVQAEDATDKTED